MIPTELGVTSVAVRGPQGEAPGLARDSMQTAEVRVPEPSPLAVQYYHSGNVLWAVGTGLSLLLPALLLYTGWSARMRSMAFRLARSWLPSLMVYALLFTAISAILGLPLTFYEGFVRQHAYGLSNQSLSKWVADWLKGVGLSGLGLALVLWIPYLLLRRSRRWWLYAGLASAPIATFLLIVAPVWVDPLFNHFGPMKDRVLEQRILQLAERAGIPGSRVYQVDKSVDTKTVNAYVTGVGTTKRIVLWDTILEKLDPDQVAFVAAHEMGHFVLGHVATLIGVITLLVTLSLYVVHRLAGRLISRSSDRFGFDSLADFASLPLLLLLSTAVSLITTPLVLAYTRHQEHEADRFGLELTRGNHAAATTFVRLQQENLAVPRPGALYRLWRGSHPPLGDRVDFANRYRPWETGEPLRYGGLFR
ncbi:MAG: M48 family metallopeptidase [Gemmatimonadales bacterium]